MSPRSDAPIDAKGAGMSSIYESVTTRHAGRPAWRRPQLQELGNLRSFVREGQAMGKSGPLCDGSTSGNQEAMDNQNPCPPS
jgi:hypothetical protein